MAHSEGYTLRELIADYDLGLVTDNQLVSKLAGWDYVAQDSNSSPWAADAGYVEGSWDDVELAFDMGIIPEKLYFDIYDALEGTL